MQIPSGKIVRTYPEKSEYEVVTDQIIFEKFTGYILVITPIENIDAKGYLVFENGIPVIAYYEHKDAFKCEEALKNIIKNFSMEETVLELHELTKHYVNICKMRIGGINKPGSAINALDIYKNDSQSSMATQTTGSEQGSLPSDDELEAFIKESVNLFKDQSNMILESIGLGHLKPKNHR